VETNWNVKEGQPLVKEKKDAGRADKDWKMGKRGVVQKTHKSFTGNGPA
jgi:hypothetical protein